MQVTENEPGEERVSCTCIFCNETLRNPTLDKTIPQCVHLHTGNAHVLKERLQAVRSARPSQPDEVKLWRPGICFPACRRFFKNKQ